MTRLPDPPERSPRGAGLPLSARCGAQPGHPRGGIRRRTPVRAVSTAPWRMEKHIPSLKGAVESARQGAFRRMPNTKVSDQAPEQGHAGVTDSTGAGTWIACASVARAKGMTTSDGSPATESAQRPECGLPDESLSPPLLAAICGQNTPSRLPTRFGSDILCCAGNGLTRNEGT